jgi:hypothetical protein
LYGHNPAGNHHIFWERMEHYCGFQRIDSELACTIPGNIFPEVLLTGNLSQLVRRKEM